MKYTIKCAVLPHAAFRIGEYTNGQRVAKIECDLSSDEVSHFYRALAEDGTLLATLNDAPGMYVEYYATAQEKGREG